MSVSAPTPEVPSDWGIAKAGDVCEIQNGYAFKSEFFNDKQAGLPLIRIRDVHSGRSDTYYAGPFDGKYLVTDGDLLVGMDGEFRVRKWGAGRGLLNQRVCRLLPKNGPMLPEFLFYSIGRPLKQIEDFTPFTTVKHISASQIRAIELPLPPLPEQKKIAHILSTVQRAIEAQERIIQTTTELKKALMHKLFTEGLRNEPQKQTEIGPIPESWEVVELQAKAESFQYGTSVKCGYDVDGKPVLRIPNVVGGHIDPADLKFGNPKKNELGKLALEHGDLLFVRTNGVKENAGRCSKFNGELNDCYFASYLIRVRLHPATLNPDFLNEYTRTEVGTSFLSGKSIRTADGKFNINSGTLRTMLVPVPAIDEQEEIARTLALIDEKAGFALSKKSGFQDLFRTLLHELMTAKTRVHELTLAVQDA